MKIIGAVCRPENPRPSPGPSGGIRVKDGVGGVEALLGRIATSPAIYLYKPPGSRERLVITICNYHWASADTSEGARCDQEVRTGGLQNTPAGTVLHPRCSIEAHLPKRLQPAGRRACSRDMQHFFYFILCLAQEPHFGLLLLLSGGDNGSLCYEERRTASRTAREAESRWKQCSAWEKENYRQWE